MHAGHWDTKNIEVSKSTVGAGHVYLLGYDQRGASLDIGHGQRGPTCNGTCTKRSDKTRGKRIW